MYALVVGKNGPKMKASEIEPNAPAGGGPGNGGPPPPPPIRMGKDGMPQLPGGGRGPMIMMRGRGHVTAKMMSVPVLVDFLAGSVDRPVVDQTGLKGTYDFNLDFTPDESTRMPMPAGVLPPPPPPPGVGEGGGLHGAENPDNGFSLFAALQAQLGLKLEPKKGPVELIVIDRVEKAPTEN
jgi:uncharacterized protein (TIGR03435 family)